MPLAKYDKSSEYTNRVLDIINLIARSLFSDNRAAPTDPSSVYIIHIEKPPTNICPRNLSRAASYHPVCLIIYWIGPRRRVYSLCVFRLLPEERKAPPRMCVYAGLYTHLNNTRFGSTLDLSYRRQRGGQWVKGICIYASRGCARLYRAICGDFYAGLFYDAIIIRLYVYNNLPGNRGYNTVYRVKMIVKNVIKKSTKYLEREKSHNRLASLPRLVRPTNKPSTEARDNFFGSRRDSKNFDIARRSEIPVAYMSVYI